MSLLQRVYNADLHVTLLQIIDCNFDIHLRIFDSNNKPNYFISCIFSGSKYKCMDVVLNSSVDLKKYSTLLYILYVKRDLKRFKKLIKKNKYDINVFNKNWFSHLLKRIENIEYLNVLVKYKFDFGLYKCKNIKNHIMVNMLDKSSYKKAQILINAGLDINITYSHGSRRGFNRYKYVSLINHKMLSYESIIFLINNGARYKKHKNYGMYIIKCINKMRNKKIKTFMMCISSVNTDHLLCEFFKINCGLKSYIGRKISQFIPSFS
jgi:hypothetical protein